MPDEWRKAAANVKQGSSEEVLDRAAYWAAEGLARNSGEEAVRTYEALLEMGVCAEQARMVLPLNMMTEWHWTGSLLAWARVWHLRVKPEAQKETRELVQQIDAPLSEAFPHAWAVLKGGE